MFLSARSKRVRYCPQLKYGGTPLIRSSKGLKHLAYNRGGRGRMKFMTKGP